MALKIGDVVMLKSGGAVMTVDSTDFDGDQVRCTWQNEVSDNNYATEMRVFPIKNLDLLSEIKKRGEENAEKARERLGQLYAGLNRD